MDSNYLKDLFIDEAKAALNNRGGGSSGPVSWNDLEDKPFESEYQRATLIDSVAVEIPDNGFGATVDSTSVANFPKLIDGEMYTVIFDGTEYVCMASLMSQSDYSATYGLGDAEMGNNKYKESYSFPFLIECSDMFAYGYFTNNVYATPGTHTVSIIGNEEVVTKTLDTKYLDDNIATETWVGTKLNTEGYYPGIRFDIDAQLMQIFATGTTDPYIHLGAAVAILYTSNYTCLYAKKKSVSDPDSLNPEVHYYFDDNGTEYDVVLNSDGTITFSVTSETTE